MYPLKLKGISVYFSMLKAALCGSYVNFGAFRFYGDEALDNTLKTFVKLLLSIPQSDQRQLIPYLNLNPKIQQMALTSTSGNCSKIRHFMKQKWPCILTCNLDTNQVKNVIFVRKAS